MLQGDENSRPDGLGASNVEALVVKASKLATALEHTEAELNRVRSELVQSQSAVATVAQVSALEAHAREVEAKMQALCQKNDDMRNQRDSSLVKASKFQSQIESLQCKLDVQTAAFSKEKDAMAEERLQMEAVLAHREKKLLALEAECKAKIAQAITEAEERVAKAEVQEDKLKAEAQAAVAAAALAQAEVEAAKTSKEGALKEAETAKRQLEERRAAVKAGDIRAAQLEQRVAALQKQLAFAQKEVRDQDGVTLDLENQLSTTENELKSLKPLAEASFARVGELEKRVAQLEAGAQDAASDLESKDWRIDDLITQVNDLRDALRESQSETDAARATVDATRERLADLAAQRTADIEDGLNTLRHLEEEVSALKSAAARKELAARAAQEELAVLRSNNAAVAGDDADNRAALTTEVARLRARVAQLQSNLSKRKTAGAADRAVVEEMEKRLVEAEGRVAAAQAARATATTEVGRLRSAIQVKDAEISSLRSELEMAMQANASLREAAVHAEVLENKVKELEEALVEGASELEAKNWRLDDLLDQVNDLRDEAAAAEEHRLAAEQAHQLALLEQRETLQVDTKKVVESLKKQSLEEVQALKTSASQLETRLQKAEASITTLKEKLRTAKTASKKRDMEVKQLTEERSALMSTVQDLQDALKSQEEKHMDTARRLTSTQAELKSAQGQISATESLIEKLAVMKGAAAGQTNKASATAVGKENGGLVAGGGKLPQAQQRNVPLMPRSGNAIQ
jgi:chromosome segregation ATPase